MGSRTTKGRTILFAKTTWVLIDHGKHKDTHPTSQHSMDVQSLLNKKRGKTRHPSTTNNFEAEIMQQQQGVEATNPLFGGVKLAVRFLNNRLERVLVVFFLAPQRMPR